jgi:hypothetical protein
MYGTSRRLSIRLKRKLWFRDRAYIDHPGWYNLPDGWAGHIPYMSPGHRHTSQSLYTRRIVGDWLDSSLHIYHCSYRCTPRGNSSDNVHNKSRQTRPDIRLRNIRHILRFLSPCIDCRNHRPYPDTAGDACPHRVHTTQNTRTDSDNCGGYVFHRSIGNDCRARSSTHNHHIGHDTYHRVHRDSVCSSGLQNTQGGPSDRIPRSMHMVFAFPMVSGRDMLYIGPPYHLDNPGW